MLSLQLIQSGNALARCHLFNLKTSPLTPLPEPDTALIFPSIYHPAQPRVLPPSSPWEQLDNKRENEREGGTEEERERATAFRFLTVRLKVDFQGRGW